MAFDVAGLHSELLFQDINVMEILRIWIEYNTTHEVARRMCVLWNIWKTRNDIVFSQGSFCINVILKNILHDVELCMENYGKNDAVNVSTVQEWSPPVHPFVKINVDVAFIPNNGVAGVVAQNSNGRFLGCASSTFVCISSLLEETIACRLGLELGLRHNFSHVIIQGDATNVTAAILGDSRDFPWSITYYEDQRCSGAI
ncbi:uncharacterized protein LOC113271907 [Papaver somniferum]|uniref:uncharacterized protein LOC113271907 n=1 Tax=Papaver somniferum TaxID=3469 RepID=UPI000E6F7D76|nr:uncharacterized protein LOC113271907 [Papaver somniferum]